MFKVRFICPGGSCLSGSCDEIKGKFDSWFFKFSHNYAFYRFYDSDFVDVSELEAPSFSDDILVVHFTDSGYDRLFDYLSDLCLW